MENIVRNEADTKVRCHIIRNFVDYVKGFVQDLEDCWLLLWRQETTPSTFLDLHMSQALQEVSRVPYFMETIHLVIILASLSRRHEAQVYSTWLRALTKTRARLLLPTGISRKVWSTAEISEDKKLKSLTLYPRYVLEHEWIIILDGFSEWDGS